MLTSTCPSAHSASSGVSFVVVEVPPNYVLPTETKQGGGGERKSNTCTEKSPDVKNMTAVKVTVFWINGQIKSDEGLSRNLENLPACYKRLHNKEIKKHVKIC